MGFAIYSVKESAEGTLLLRRVSALRLGGTSGILAGKVPALAGEDGRWSLPPAAILGVDPAGQGILFESSVAGERPSLQRVRGLHGQSSAEESELLVEMEPLEVLEENSGELRVRPSGIHSSEALRLLGGTTPGRGTWNWAEPKMQLGSTVLGAARKGLACLAVAFCLLFGLQAGPELRGAPPPAGGAAKPGKDKVVLVAAAANLSPLLPDLKNAFTEGNAASLEFSEGSSGKLTTQILNGAPFQVFLSADEGYPARLSAEHLCAEPPAVYVQGVLVLVFRKELAAAEGGGLDWTRVRRLGLADPELAPYGRAARDYLEGDGAKLHFHGERALGQSIGQTAQFLATGAVDAAFLALSQVGAFPEKDWEWTIVPEKSYTPIRQAAALLKGPGGQPPGAEAAAFYAFLFTEPAQAIFKKAGYHIPAPQDAGEGPSPKDQDHAAPAPQP